MDVVCIPRDSEILAFMSPPARVQAGETAGFNHLRRQLFWRSQIARMSRICVTIPHQIVGFGCDLDSACLQISVLEFQLFGCG